MNAPDATEQPPITELTRQQRRVLGVLSEKAFTTPEYYPLTLKAVTAGCNQKSNRDPVVSYSEEDVLDVLEELRGMGLAAVVLPDSGRTERYRHYFRHRFSLTEPQLAILTELLLRGRQSMGELRSRSSRMVPIESLGQLREELAGLIELGFAVASGDLERRGIEVDHAWYQPREQRPFAAGDAPAAAPSATTPVAAAVAVADTGAAPVSAPGAAATVASGTPAAGASPEQLDHLEQQISQLRSENQELRNDMQVTQQSLAELRDQLDDLRRQLGG